MNDITRLSFEDLDRMEKEIREAKETVIAREIEEFDALVQEIKNRAERHGISLKKIFGIGMAHTLPRKVRNPETGEIESLRGRRPPWLKAMLEGLDKNAVEEKLKSLEVTEPASTESF